MDGCLLGEQTRWSPHPPHPARPGPTSARPVPHCKWYVRVLGTIGQFSTMGFEADIFFEYFQIFRRVRKTKNYFTIYNLRSKQCIEVRQSLYTFHHGADGDLRPNLRLRRSKMEGGSPISGTKIVDGSFFDLRARRSTNTPQSSVFGREE